MKKMKKQEGKKEDPKKILNTLVNRYKCQLEDAGLNTDKKVLSAIKSGALKPGFVKNLGKKGITLIIEAYLGPQAESLQIKINENSYFLHCPYCDQAIKYALKKPVFYSKTFPAQETIVSRDSLNKKIKELESENKSLEQDVSWKRKDVLEEMHARMNLERKLESILNLFSFRIGSDLNKAAQEFIESHNRKEAQNDIP